MALLPSNDRDRLAQRREADLPLSRVTALPSAELAEQAARRLIRPVDPRSWTYLGSSLFDRRVAARIGDDAPAIVHAFEHSALETFRAAKAAGAIAVLEQPIIHIDAYSALESAAIARTGKTPPKRPVGYWRHIRRKQREYALADYCVVGLPSAADTMIAGGFPRKRVFVTPYGTPEAAPADSSLTHPSTDGPLRILFVGHLDFYKGLHVLLDAWEELDRDLFSLTIVGISNPSWYEYFIDRIGTQPNVTYLGAVPSSRMAAIYAEHDVLAFPSQVGGVGLSTFEALNAGVVPIVPTAEALLVDGGDCIVVSDDTPRSWALALTRLEADRHLLTKLSQGARQSASRFSPTSYLQSLRVAYEEIAESEGLDEMLEVLRSSPRKPVPTNG